MQDDRAGGIHRPAAPTLSVAVLTHNEAHRIRACLESAAAIAHELVVVDSGSTDGTVAAAEAAGARVFSYPDWQGFAVQRNRLLAHCTGDYVFFLDADEQMTPALRDELQAIVQRNERAVWKIRWRMVAFGRPLTWYRAKSQIERLFRRDMLREFTGVVHEEAQLLGEPVPRHLVRAPLLHHSRETVRASLDKLTQYAMLGAAKRAALGKRGGVLRGLASGISMFVRLYVLRLGFLCGGAGFLYCLFVALESFFRYAALHYDRDDLSGRVGR
ncbi:glycosyltransferase family 2 protein [Xylophilus sp. GW821-FHT01B05]